MNTTTPPTPQQESEAKRLELLAHALRTRKPLRYREVHPLSRPNEWVEAASLDEGWSMDLADIRQYDVELIQPEQPPCSVCQGGPQNPSGYICPVCAKKGWEMHGFGPGIDVVGQPPAEEKRDEVRRKWMDWNQLFGDGIIDPDGFDRANPDKLYTLDEYKTGLIRCTRKLASSSAEEKWRPIESAPRNSTAIILAQISHGEVSEIDVGNWEYDPGMNTPDGYEPSYWYWSTGRGIIEEPTHWIPLPATPAEPQQCPVCGGMGTLTVPPNPTVNCPDCKGTGLIPDDDQPSPDKCPKCGEDWSCHGDNSNTCTYSEPSPAPTEETLGTKFARENREQMTGLTQEQRSELESKAREVVATVEGPRSAGEAAWNAQWLPATAPKFCQQDDHLCEQWERSAAAAIAYHLSQSPPHPVAIFHGKGGWENERESAKKILVEGHAYKVLKQEVGQSVTYLILEGLQGRWNSCLFDADLSGLPDSRDERYMAPELKSSHPVAEVPGVPPKRELVNAYVEGYNACSGLDGDKVEAGIMAVCNACVTPMQSKVEALTQGAEAIQRSFDQRGKLIQELKHERDADRKEVEKHKADSELANAELVKFVQRLHAVADERDALQERVKELEGQLSDAKTELFAVIEASNRETLDVASERSARVKAERELAFLKERMPKISNLAS